MKRLGLILVMLMLTATNSHAGYPYPANCTLGINLPAAQRPFMSIEGATGFPDPCSDGRCADYTIEVRDLFTTPLDHSSLSIDFSECSDIVISCDQLHSATGQAFVSPKIVSGSTDPNGRFTFRVQGSSSSATLSLPPDQQSPGTQIGTPCAHVYADGVLLGSLKVSAYDIDGLGSQDSAVNVDDYNTLNAEILRGAATGIRFQRSDLNGDGAANAADLALMNAMIAQQRAGTGSRNTGHPCEALTVDRRPIASELTASPNPLCHSTRVRFALAEPSAIRAGVFDVAGRQVRSLFVGWMDAGEHRLSWDGLDQAGRATGGVYFIRVERGGATLVTRVTRLQ